MEEEQPQYEVFKVRYSSDRLVAISKIALWGSSTSFLTWLLLVFTPLSPIWLVIAGAIASCGWQTKRSAEDLLHPKEYEILVKDGVIQK